MHLRSRLILAIDEIDPVKSIEIARAVRRMDAIKVGYPLVLSAGIGIVKELSTISDVICDFKIADIPDVNKKIVNIAFDAGASAIITHAFPGSDSMEASVGTAHDRGGEAFVVVEMSHQGALQYMQPHTSEMVRAAIEGGADGLIVPGTRPGRIREIRRQVGIMKLACPGIGTQGGTAKEAIEAGADYIIVGRTVCSSKDPGATSKALVIEVGGKWD